MKLQLLVVGFVALACLPSFGQINNDKPPFSLTLEQLEKWSATSELADIKNISKQPIAQRFIASLLGDKKHGNKDPKIRVLLAPDGMNNFGNYLEPQAKFNHYTFTNWHHIDVLNWFAGTATQTINIPARPWVDAAHKNGVKVIGSIFLAIAQYGGNPDTAGRLLKRGENGGFPAAHKLIDIAQFYGFDGWLMNQETDLAALKDINNDLIEGKLNLKRAKKLASEMQAFMAYLTKIAPEGIEIHWYDSMLMNGRVRWQNELNNKNQMFLQDNTLTESRVADAMFVNYWWDQSMLKASNRLAKQLNRSPYDVYFGVDLWPERKAQSMFVENAWLDEIFSNDNDTAWSSIALFANNVNFNFDGNEKLPALSRFKIDKHDHQRFYESEQRLFIGDDQNLMTDDGNDNWSGIGRYVPAKSTLTQLPFETHFNTGHGLIHAEQGNKVSGEWHNMSEQDLLPTWQFAVEGNRSVQLGYDFTQPYTGGSSLSVHADTTQGVADVPLYQSRFTITKNTKLTLVFKTNLATGSAHLWLETADGKKHVYALQRSVDDWFVASHSLKGLAGQSVQRFGLGLSESLQQKGSIRIGYLGIE